LLAAALGPSIADALRQRSVQPVLDTPLLLADEMAYATGVWRGAWEARSWRAVKPTITFATGGLQALLKKNETPSTQR
jgi:hypothetical protein